MPSGLPRPRPLPYLNYSFYATWHRCALAVAYGRDPAYKPLNRTTISAALGSAIHEVYARVAMIALPLGAEDSARKQVIEIWNDEVGRQSAKLASAWAPANVPQPAEWPYYSSKKARTIRHLTAELEQRNLLHNPSAESGATGGNHGFRFPLRERTFTDETLKIEGTPDLVERRNGDLWVIDLKTGETQEEPSEEQVTQLRLYAHLVHVCTGETPLHGAIATPGGTEFPVSWTTQEIQDTVQAILQAGKDYVDRCDEGFSQADATPSESHCVFCAFRPVCATFSVQVEEAWKVPNSATAKVLAVTGDAPWLSLDVEILTPSWHAGTRARVVEIPWTETVPEGSRVAFDRFSTRMDWSLIRGEWNSVSAVLDDANTLK
jgi:hypothetical protein